MGFMLAASIDILIVQTRDEVCDKVKNSNNDILHSVWLRPVVEVALGASQDTPQCEGSDWIIQTWISRFLLCRAQPCLQPTSGVTHYWS